MYVYSVAVTTGTLTRAASLSSIYPSIHPSICNNLELCNYAIIIKKGGTVALLLSTSLQIILTSFKNYVTGTLNPIKQSLMIPPHLSVCSLYHF